MRKLVTTLLGITLLAGTANAQIKYKYPPGPPFRTCPDTLSIYDVQYPDTLIAPCHPSQYSPASGDTVLGIKGIIIGFDAKPSAFAFYMQNSQGTPYSGVQVFTGAYNWAAFPYNLALGDSVAVYGTTQEFPPGTNGTTEIEGPDVTQGTNDIIIRKITSGNPLPPYQIHTTTTMSWIPGTTQEAWEGALVRLRGPLRVGRTSTQGGRPGLPGNSFLIVSVASPSDSTLIDGTTLTTFTPPAVGTLLDSLQGIVNQGTSGSPTFTSYRVQIRDGDDLFGPFATSLTDAYPIADSFTGPQAGPQDGPRIQGTSNTTVRLDFGRRVDVATAEDESKYSLASQVDGSTVDLATVTNGGKSVHLDITSVRIDGDQETVTAAGIGSESCPACLMSTQNRTFINGVLDVKQVQAAHADSLAGSVCTDRSRYGGPGSAPGTRLTVRGVGVGQFGSLQYIEDADAAERSGVSVFGPSESIILGDRYLIAGQIQEFGGETEIVNNVFLQRIGTVGIPPIRVGKNITSLTDSTCDAAQNIDNGEDKEGMLIKIVDLRVAEKRTIGQSWFAAGPCCSFTDTILVSNLNQVLNAVTPPDSGSIVDVTGILHFASGTFRICPRSAADIFVHAFPLGVGDGLSGRVEFSAFPNPARSTRINFSLPRKDNVELGVYDVLGRRVTVLAKGTMPAGAYSRQWEGRDDSGKNVGPGVYFLRLKVGQETFKLRSVKLN
jgi:hypothetical protein